MMRPTTTNWLAVQEHLDHLLLDTDQQPVNFLVWTPNGFGQHFTKNGKSISRGVDQVLRQHRDAALGFVVNPGGTQAADITECVALFVEDDSGAAIADQLIAWRAAGLPEPSLSVFTGAKSVHHYWTLAERIAPAVFTTMQRRLIAVMGAAHPGSEFDRSLAKANQVMRVAGSIHPKTGRPAEIKRATGERHLLAELEAALTAAEERFGLLADPQPAPPPPGHSSDDSRRAVEMLRHIDPLQFSSYDDWLKVGLALFNTDQGLLSAWVDWCRPMPTFDEGECLVKWQSFAKPYSGPTRSIASLHQWAKAGGYQEPKQQRSAEPQRHQESAPPAAEARTIDELLGPVEDGKLRRPRTDLLPKVLALAVPLRFNQLTQRIENDGQPIDGDFLGTLYLQLAERFQIEVAKDRACDAAILQARRSAFHPVRDYLSSGLPTLDPMDWVQIAACCFSTPDPMAQIHLQRQLIGLVARAMNPGCKLDTALVIHSPQQGIGKSTVWSILGGPWFSDSLGDLKNLKDDVLQLHSAWIHEWGEIDAVVGKRESESLKKFLSASKDDVRRPYGRGVETLVRSCGIVGTTNRSDFIKDPTGNRRFPVIAVQQVNTDWIRANRDAIWGSALAAFNAGTPWHYDNAENAQITKEAQNFAAEDPLRDQIETWMDDNPEIRSVAMPVLVHHLNPEKLRDQEFSRQVSLRLTALGWSKSTKRERGYLPNGERHDKATVWTLPQL